MRTCENIDVIEKNINCAVTDISVNFETSSHLHKNYTGQTHFTLDTVWNLSRLLNYYQ